MRSGPAAQPQQPVASASPDQALVNRYCAGCHSARTRAGNLVLAGVDVASAGSNPELWEKVVRKMRNGLMPPAGNPRPDEATYQQFLTRLQNDLDAAAAARPNPGRTEIVHRLNRLEYRNAVRDLLAVEVDVADLLPADDSSYGFDNIAGVLKMSPALVERYLSAARVISRTAVGSPPASAAAAIYRVSPELQQHDRDDRLPLGTRGGTLVRHVSGRRRVRDQSRSGWRGRRSGRGPASARNHHRRRAGQRSCRAARRAPGADAGHWRAARHRRDVLPRAARPRRTGARAVRESRRAVEHRRHHRPPAVRGERDHRRPARRERPRRHAEPAAAVHLHAGGRGAGSELRADDRRRPWRAAPTAGCRRREQVAGADDLLRERPRRRRRLRRRASSSRCGVCSSAPSSCTGSKADPARCTPQSGARRARP